MTSRSAPRAAQRLRDDLHRLFKITSVDGADALRTVGSGIVSLLVDRDAPTPPLVFADHFDFTGDLLVYDGCLGTLGAVHCLHDGTADPAEAVRRAVEHAAYLRHLALGQPGRDRSRPQSDQDARRPLPLTVEVVLVVPPDDEGFQKAIGDALRAIIQEGDYLHGIGVGVLPYDAETGGDEARIRRAFCWLLMEVRAWYDALPRHHPADRAGQPPFAGLVVSDWRLPGRRTLKLHRGTRVHLVHGSNGSGKSSMVEAVEMLVTGVVERLKEEDDVALFIDHTPRDPGEPRRPATAAAIASPRLCRYRSGRPHEPLALDYPAGAFRLNQETMDRLSVPGSDVKRAVEFITTFFPDLLKLSTDHYYAKKGADECLAKLPKSLQEDIGPPSPDGSAALEERLAWTEAGGSVLEGFERDCLPRPLDELRALASLAPALEDALTAFAGTALPVAAIEERAPTLESAFGRFHMEIRETRRALQDAAAALGLRSLDAWRPSAAPGRATAETLNAWLQATTFADLARRQREILRALSRAQAGKWEPDMAAEGGLLRLTRLNRATEGELDRQVDVWAAAAQERQQRVADLGSAERAADDGMGPAARPHLTDAQIRNLDAVTPMLFHGWRTGGAALGQTITRAVATGEAVAIGDVIVGSGDWLGMLRQRTASLLDRINDVDSIPLEEWRPYERWQRLIAARDANRALLRAADAVNVAFLNRVLPVDGAARPDESAPPFDNALNELIMLFTPARWGYDTVGLARTVDGNGQPAIGIRYGGQGQGDLRLNTAELNLFAVCLFLLCAPSTRNPLGLLVLDDPLQNMDELTATTFARGLAKLQLLLGADWTLLLFFHGEDDLERFAWELPAATYRLPWLTPSSASRPVTIRGEAGRDSRRQAIADLMGAGPPPR